MTKQLTFSNKWEGLPVDALVPISTVADMMGCTRQTVARRLKAGEMPMPIYFGTRKRWRYGDILDFVRQKPEGDAA